VAKDEFVCWRDQGSRQYASASANVLNKNYWSFCDEAAAQKPTDTLGWSCEKGYYEGTLDDFTFRVLPRRAHKCKEFRCIINGWDGNGPNNLLNFKFGGQRVAGPYTYFVGINRKHRAWPVPTKVDGKWNSWYHFLYSDYQLYGKGGWAGWDHGQETILPAAKGCLGLRVTKLNMKYLGTPDKDGFEWRLEFRTPIWVNARCFKNNKVVKGAGGFTNGCGGSDA